MENTTRPDNAPALYCGTYAKYNNGSIKGAWLYLDDYADADEFYKACAKLHKDEADPEYMFQDFEHFPKELYSESGNVAQIYEYINLEDGEREMVDEYLDATGYNFEDNTIELAQDSYMTTLDSSSEEAQHAELGEYYANELGILDGVTETLSNYFDYEAYGRDIAMDCSISSNGFVFSSN